MTFEWNDGILVLTLAITIDVVWGELPTRLHPVVWMGRAITAGEALFPRRHRPRDLIVGALLALTLVVVFGGLALALDFWIGNWFGLGIALRALLLSSCLALRGLSMAAHHVERALSTGDLAAGRLGLRSLCSRDASQLSASEVAAASVESVAENTADSFVAPLFFFCLFGLPGAVVYRVVNTLDARLGYRGEYEYYGKASARMDDLLNLIPARLTAAILLVGGPAVGFDGPRAWRIWWRDRQNTSSPNAGHPMAAMAGLLGVRLGKDNDYVLGEGLKAPANESITQARCLMWVTGALTAAIAALTMGVHFSA